MVTMVPDTDVGDYGARDYGARHQVYLTPHSQPAKNAQSHENTNKTTTH